MSRASNQLSSLLVWIFFVGCGGGSGQDAEPVTIDPGVQSGSDPVENSNAELEGTWTAHEVGVEADDEFDFTGTEFSFDSPRNAESYSGTFVADSNSSPKIVDLKILQSSNFASANLVSKCIYSLNASANGGRIACASPGVNEYPATFTSSNVVRVWDLSLTSGVAVTPVSIFGTWSTLCANATKVSYIFEEGNKLSILLDQYGDDACNSAPTSHIIDAKGNFAIGELVKATKLNTNVAVDAYKLDLIGNGVVYTIFYVDSAMNMYFGDANATPGLDGRAADTRPTILNPYPYRKE